MNLKYIDKITLKYGDFTLSEYLNYSGRNYATYLIDYSQKDITFCDGLLDSELKENSREGLNLQSNGLCALYGERKCSSSNLPVDVIMMEKKLWESADVEKRELVIFHEVCHLLEKTGYYQKLNIELTEYELKVGAKLHEIAEKVDGVFGGFGIDEDHNQTFGAILFHFLNQYDKERCYNLLAISMICNFLDDYTNEFQEII